MCRGGWSYPNLSRSWSLVFPHVQGWLDMLIFHPLTYNGFPSCAGVVGQADTHPSGLVRFSLMCRGGWVQISTIGRVFPHVQGWLGRFINQIEHPVGFPSCAGVVGATQIISHKILRFSLMCRGGWMPRKKM